MPEELLKYGMSVIAIGPSPVMLEYLKKRFDQALVDCREESGEYLPVADNSIDYVFVKMFLHHTENPPITIIVMTRILKTGGKLIITDLEKHNYEFLRTEQYDQWLGFEAGEILEWFIRAGLERVNIHPIGEYCCGTSTCGCEQAKINIWAITGDKPSAMEEPKLR